MMQMFWGESMGDDRVIEPYFDVVHVFTESDWGLHETTIGGGDGNAYTWDAPLGSYADLDRLRFPEITVDHSATRRVVGLAEEAFGDLLTVRLKTHWWWSLGMTTVAIKLRGLEQLMVDMCDAPGGVHALMAFLRDGHLAKLDFLEANSLLALNNDGTYVGSGGFGYSNELPQAGFDGDAESAFSALLRFDITSA